MNKRLIDVCKLKENIITIEPDATIKDAVYHLNKHKIGCLIVMENTNIIGIISERDILSKLGTTDVKDEIHTTKISEIMTPKENLVVGHPEDTVEYLMNVMNEKKIRHIPLVSDEGKLVCLTSIRDIIRILLKDSKAKVKYLSDYVQGKY
ncbi:MAG: CBS domain-containing protein [Candidatus Cloacimonetes bacterium]|jgi:CBS domain-containing protein|nr:CBS domain-containing protein [Candidatus Cloacimonadota bacterium]MBT4333456.1 CBS domain-containing protein [Candidatus Cloacimonadota bacterium]MBT4574832.1 CBS domain-containing protein [Candidatus Cloacimonadota bacterium]